MRLAGITVPLFSLRTDEDWGIGDFASLVSFGKVAGELGFGLLQILPIGEIDAEETSPYTALSSFALDPIYLDPAPMFRRGSSAALATLGENDCALLRDLRCAPRVRWSEVRRVKMVALRAAFEEFERLDFREGTPLAVEFVSYIEECRAWLNDWSLYRAVREEFGGTPWYAWPEGERERAPGALSRAHEALAREVMFRKFLAWQCDRQLALARERLHHERVLLMGDVPFVVGRDSADVWANRNAFDLQGSLGVPPDGFNPNGQNWGLPPYSWPDLARDEWRYLVARVRVSAMRFDWLRLDHVVGYFREFVFQPSGESRFVPDSDRAAAEGGHARLAAIAREVGATRIVAEDLGVIPDYVRTEIASLGWYGYRVLPWEWDGDTIRDPSRLPANTVATLSTHDTSPIGRWLTQMQEREREALASLAQGADASLDLDVRLLARLLGAPSDLVLVQAEELWRGLERVNEPGTVGPHNWTTRLPASSASLARMFGTDFARIRDAIAASDRRPG